MNQKTVEELGKPDIITGIIIIVLTALSGFANMSFLAGCMFIIAVIFVILGYITTMKLLKSTLYKNMDPLDIIQIEVRTIGYLLLLALNAMFGYWITFTIWLIVFGIAFFNWFTYVNLYGKRCGKSKPVLKSLASQREENNLLKVLFVLSTVFFMLLSVHYYSETKQLRVLKTDAIRSFYKQDAKIRNQALIEAEQAKIKDRMEADHRTMMFQLDGMIREKLKK